MEIRRPQNAKSVFVKRWLGLQYIRRPARIWSKSSVRLIFFFIKSLLFCLVADEEDNEKIRALIPAGAEDRRIDRTSACRCSLLLLASACCCCCCMLLAASAVAAAAARRSCCCTTVPLLQVSSAADVANVYFPNKNPILSLFRSRLCA